MKKINKKIYVVIIIVFVLVLTFFLIIDLRLFQFTSSERLPNLYFGNIEQYESENDTDGDLIDDQMDILLGAIDYIETRPKYKSKYYETGYPDDQFGVCTDVVAFALKNAGIDLMELVNQDILSNPDLYDIAEPDINIDFRRVRNLKIFFDKNAICLTTDISDISSWQGGDIVIFDNHIGIVSDRRNADGIPYVIHHNDSFQKSYEEDLLSVRDDIYGHYRVDGLSNDDTIQTILVIFEEGTDYSYILNLCDYLELELVYNYESLNMCCVRPLTFMTQGQIKALIDKLSENDKVLSAEQDQEMNLY